MSEGKDQVVQLSKMPKKPKPVGMLYYEDQKEKGLTKEKKIAEVLKSFADESDNEKSKYKKIFDDSYAKYKEELQNWREEADKAGYVENVEYATKDIESALQKFNLNVDISECDELIGKIAGLWVVKMLKSFTEKNSKHEKMQKAELFKALSEFIKEDKLLKDSTYFKSSEQYIGKIKRDPDYKKSNEIDAYEPKPKKEEKREKVKDTKEINHGYKSNKLENILKKKE